MCRSSRVLVMRMPSSSRPKRYTQLTSNPEGSFTLESMLWVRYTWLRCTRMPLGCSMPLATTVVFTTLSSRMRRRRMRPLNTSSGFPDQPWLSQMYRSPSGPKAMPMGKA